MDSGFACTMLAYVVLLDNFNICSVYAGYVLSPLNLRISKAMKMGNCTGTIKDQPQPGEGF